MIPDWLHALALASLSLGGLCAFIIAVDELRHPQHMWIMDVVWPVVALFGSVIVLWLYFSYGRLAIHEIAKAAQAKGQEPPSKRQTPSR